LPPSVSRQEYTDRDPYNKPASIPLHATKEKG